MNETMAGSAERICAKINKRINCRNNLGYFYILFGS